MATSNRAETISDFRVREALPVVIDNEPHSSSSSGHFHEEKHHDAAGTV